MSCGTTATTAACTPCTMPANGTATCNGTPLACGINCTTGLSPVRHGRGRDVRDQRQHQPSLRAGTAAPCARRRRTAPSPAAPPGACVRACNTGFHLCGTGANATCVANNSVASGCTANGCTACATPANATAVCSGTTCSVTCATGFHGCPAALRRRAWRTTASRPVAPRRAAPRASIPPTAIRCATRRRCGVDCNTGYHPCGSGASTTCVVNGSTSINSCGNTCTVCTPPADNGSVTCNAAGTCVQACNTGWHLCNGVCVSNNASATCGTMNGVDCTPCPDGYGVRDRGLRRRLRCWHAHLPGDERLFPQRQHPAVRDRGVVHHVRAALRSERRGRVHGQPVQHRLQGRVPSLPGAGTGPCVANTSLSSCGTSCTACPAPPANGMAACDNSRPAEPQPAGSSATRRASACAGRRRRRPAWPTTPSPPAARRAPPARRRANGTVTCNGTACVPACNAGFHLCGTTTCVANTNATRVHGGVHAVRDRRDLRQQRLHRRAVAGCSPWTAL